MISFPELLLAILDKLSSEVAQCPPNIDPVSYTQALIRGKREIILDGFEEHAETNPEIDQTQSPEPLPVLIGTPLFSRAEIILRGVNNNRLGASQLARLIKEKQKVKGTMASIRAALISEIEQAADFGVIAQKETRAANINGRDISLTAYYFSVV